MANLYLSAAPELARSLSWLETEKGEPGEVEGSRIGPPPCVRRPVEQDARLMAFVMVRAKSGAGRTPSSPAARVTRPVARTPDPWRTRQF